MKVKTIDEIYESHLQSKNGFKAAIPTTITYNGELELDENLLRLAVAVQADGSCIKGDKYKVSLKKKRKIERLRYLLTVTQTEFKESVYGDYHEFRFKSSYGCKIFPTQWYNLCSKNKEQIVEEVFYWDGTFSKNSSGSFSQVYFSTVKENADFIQYCITSCGKQSVIRVDSRGRKRKDCYRVSLINQNKSWLCSSTKKNKILVKHKNTPCFCFKTKTGFFLCRRNGKIFITGNCGEGHLMEVVKKYFPLCEWRSTDLVYRGYGCGGIDFLKSDFRADLIITNPPFSLMNEFITHGLEQTNRYLVLFGKIQTLETVEHVEILQKSPIKYIYVHSKRQATWKNGKSLDPKGNKWATTMCLAWFVWDKEYKGEPIVRWI